MLWHRQAIFESKGDKLSSSAEGRIRTHQGHDLSPVWRQAITWTKADLLSIDLIHKCRNAPVLYPTMFYLEYKCAHFCSEWSIVRYGTDAFWDLWHWSLRPSGTNFSKFRINIRNFSFRKMYLKMSSAKCPAILSRKDELRGQYKTVYFNIRTQLPVSVSI